VLRFGDQVDPEEIASSGAKGLPTRCALVNGVSPHAKPEVMFAWRGPSANGYRVSGPRTVSGMDRNGTAGRARSR